MIRMCCVCQRVEQGREWRYVETLAADAQVTHGYCPQCFVQAMADIETVIGKNQVASVMRVVRQSNWSPHQGQWNPCA